MSQASFYGLPLLSTPGRVMTPRPATERLVAEAAARVGDRPARIADVGTGSGAIAVGVAVAAPRAEVWATDLSATAVLLARANARRLGVGNRVHVLRGDLLERVPGELDLVVANLPYLPSADRACYPELAGEPDEAVFAGGDGLDPYRRLLDAAEERLAPDGAVVIQLHRRVLMADRDDVAALRATLSALGGERSREREATLDPRRELFLSPQVV